MTTQPYESAYLLFRSNLRAEILRARAAKNTPGKELIADMLSIEEERGRKAREEWQPVVNTPENLHQIQTALHDALRDTLDGLGQDEAQSAFVFVEGVDVKTLVKRGDS